MDRRNVIPTVIGYASAGRSTALQSSNFYLPLPPPCRFLEAQQVLYVISPESHTLWASRSTVLRYQHLVLVMLSQSKLSAEFFNSYIQGIVLP